MTLEFLNRLRKELTITANALQEATLAVSERVSRKVQILRLHWQAASVTRRLQAVYQDLGRHLADALGRTRTDDDPGVRFTGIDEVKRAIDLSAGQVRQLKHSLSRLDHLIRELQVEAAHEDLLKIHRDLALRSAALERVIIARDSLAVGRSIRELDLSPTVRIAAILRGPFLIPLTENLIFRTDDVVILLGPQDDLAQALPHFLVRRSVKIA